MYIIYVLTLLLAIARLESKRLIIQWKRFDCIINPDIVIHHKCFTVDQAKSIISAEVVINRDLIQYNASFVLYLPQGRFHRFYKTYETILDVCEFFKDTYQNKLVQIAYKSMLKYSNMPKNCPQPRGFYYYHNMSIGDYLPPFLPQYDFRVRLDFFLPDAPIFNITLNGRLTHPPKRRALIIQLHDIVFNKIINII